MNPADPTALLPVRQRTLDEAWRQHPERDQLDAYQAERDANGMKRWQAVYGPDPDDADWTGHWLRPVDPLDPREPILIVRWPDEWMTRQEQIAAAVATEHDA